MKKDPKIFLKHILECITDIEDYTNDISYKQFYSDRKTQDAVVRRIAIIGEAANNVSKTIQKDYPDIEWRKIIDMRNFVIHEYFGVDLELVWGVAGKKIEKLKKQISKILKEIK